MAWRVGAFVLISSLLFTVLLLLNLYEEKKAEFDKSKSFLKHSSLFNEIASDMVAFEVRMTGRQCQSLLDRLVMRNRKESDQMQRTGSGRMEWEFFKRMLEVFGETSTIKAPVCVSAGRRLLYTIRGEAKEPEVRNSRTRPKSSLLTQDKPKNSPKNPPSSRQPTFKNWYRTYQDKQEEQRSDLAKELALTRQAYERNSAERTALFRQALAHICGNTAANQEPTE